MVSLSNLIKLITACFLAISAGGPGFEGRVVDEKGLPIQDAFVLLVRKGAPDIALGNTLVSDASGTFHLRSLPDALYVQHDGYQPTLYRIDGVDRNPLVVMKPFDSASGVTVPTCPQVLTSQEKILSQASGYRLISSEKLSFEEETRDDREAGVSVIVYPGKKQQTMTISWGAGALLSYPSIDVLARTNSLVVRQIEGTGQDVSGITAEGGRWRRMFTPAGHIEYYDASEDAAAFFDRQISGLCRIEQNSKSK